MSFPKARLLRFNEVSTCAPPPGKYDPKYDQKIKGAVIEKSKRFMDPKVEAAPSVASHDSASSCSHNYNPAATFRTPQLPRKARLVSTPRSAVERPTSRNQPNQPTPDCKSRKKLDLGFETEKNLIEQINELTRVHTSQLLEKDQELSHLQRELADVRAEKTKAEQNHIMDYNTMKQAYEKAIEKMKLELEELSKNAAEDKAESEALCAELQAKIVVLQENVINSNAICFDLEEQLHQAKAKLDEVQDEYANLTRELQRAQATINEMVEEKKSDNDWIVSVFPVRLEEAVSAAEKDIDDLTQKMKEKLRILENHLDVERLETHRRFTSEIDSLTLDVKDRVDLFEQKSGMLQGEIQAMSEAFECKINDLVNSIVESVAVADRNLKENLLLTEQLEKARAASVEKQIVIVDLQNEIEELQSRLGQLTNKCRKYEIVQAEATKTIRVLSDRLFESETEVERLNEKTEELMLRRDALEGKVKSVVDENTVLKMDINNLQVSLVRDVKEVENSLLAKVETYRRHTVEETQKLKFELDERQRTVDMLVNEVEYHRTKSSECVEYIDLCQSRIAGYKEEVAAMTERVAIMEDEYNDKLSAQKALVLETAKKLENANRKLEQLAESNAKAEKELEEAKTYNEKLTTKIATLTNKLAMKESQFEELAQEVEVKNVTMVKVSEEYEKMKLMYEEKCRKSDSVEQDHITSIALLEAELRQVEDHNRELIDSLESAEAKLARTEQTMKSTSEELVEAKNTISGMEIKIMDLERMVHMAEEEKKSLNKEKEDLVKLLNLHWGETELLKGQIEAQREEIAELKQLRDDRFEEEKAIYQAELQSEIALLQQNLEETEKLNVDLQNMNEELVFKLNSAESELTTAEADKELHENALKELGDKVAALEARCVATEKRKNEYKQFATSLEAEKKSYMEQVAELIEEKEKLSDEKKELSMQLTSTSAQLADQEIRTREAETRCKELESLVAPFQEQLAAYEKERAAMVAKSATTQKELEELAREHAKAIGHQNIRQKIHRVQQLTDANAKLKQDNEKLLAENGKLRMALLAQQDGAKRAVKSKAANKENDSLLPTAPPQSPSSPLRSRNGNK